MQGNWLRRCSVLILFAFQVTSVLQARITRIEINSTVLEGDGYERISGRAYGEVDPYDSRNSLIQDIELAPKNSSGMVEYSMDFMIQRPTEGSNGLLFYDVMNRGFPMSVFFFNRLASLMRERGATIVWSGWQGDVPQWWPGMIHTIQVPVATNNGSEITGKVRTEYMTGETPKSTMPLSSQQYPHYAYEPVDLNDPAAVLTRRHRESDPTTVIPREDWAFADCSSVPFPGVASPSHLCVEGQFQPGYLYELTYLAKNPRVLGLGFAATRDFVAFLRHANMDDYGTPNPTAGTTKAAIMQGASQSSRFVNQFVHLGFNEDEEGRIVFEGVNPLIGPARIELNVRFGQPGVASHSYRYHFRPGWETPMTWIPVRDPIADRTGWMLERCRKSDTCPKVMLMFSSQEYRDKRASLATTDPLGRHDRPLPGNVRAYLFSSSQHVASVGEVGCQQLGNHNEWQPYMRALIVALERWVLEGEQPPKSMIPTIRRGTLVPPDQTSIDWPEIPGVNYTDRVNALSLVDYGSAFNHEDAAGTLTEPPLVYEGEAYAVLVPKVDADGNEIAGIRSTRIQAPLGTYTGWNLPLPPWPEDELCGPGSFIPFAETRAERLASGDPRLSLEERYGDHEGYVEAVRGAAVQLVSEGFLLPEDAEALIEEAENSDVLK